MSDQSVWARGPRDPHPPSWAAGAVPHFAIRNGAFMVVVAVVALVVFTTHHITIGLWIGLVLLLAGGYSLVAGLLHRRRLHGRDQP